MQVYSKSIQQAFLKHRNHFCLSGEKIVRKYLPSRNRKKCGMVIREASSSHMSQENMDKLQ